MLVKRKSIIHIGTSGWQYKHWEGSFYPAGLPGRDFLDFYAKTFRTVELNNTFYQLPDEKTFTHWRTTVPEGFIFSVKASRYITHMKKLRDPRKSTSLFLERADILGEKLGPVLFQLPPRWHCNTERFHTFLDVLPRKYKCVFEFRDKSWFIPEIYDMLEEYGMAFCIYDFNGQLSPKRITADFVYLRLHGPGEPYRGQYGTAVLAGWAGAFSTWSGQGKEVYCYFDNDEAGYAAKDALRLKKMIEKSD